MKLGIGSYTYPWAIGLPHAKPNHPLRPLQLLEKAQHLGVGIVQFGPNLPLDRLAEADLREVVKQAKSWKIDLEIGMEGIDPGRLRDKLQFAKRIGAIILKTTPERPDGSIPMWSEIAYVLRPLMEEFEKEKIGLAIDNTRIAAAELNALLESIRNPYLGAALDTSAPLGFAQGWQISARVLGHRTISLHLKDFVTQPLANGMGFAITGCPMGKGNLSVPWIVESFAALRVAPSVIMESWTPEQKTLNETIALEDAWAQQGVDYLRRFIPD